jgi:polar amino acid transport system substrate-binding protein
MTDRLTIALAQRNPSGRTAGVEATTPFTPVVDGEEQIGAGGFAFRPTETRLRDAFNAELHELKDSGELLELVSPFGFTAEDMTDLTAEELCQE